MSTKTKNVGVSPFEGLEMNPNGVIIMNKTEQISEASAKPAKTTAAATKKTPVKKAEPVKKTEEEPQVQKQDFAELVNELSEKETILQKKEEELQKKEAELKKLAQDMMEAAKMLKAAEEINAKKEKEKMAEQNNTTSTQNATTNNQQVVAAETKSIDELIKMQQDQFNNMTVKVETEDCWTQTKKGFCMGAGAAAGAGLVIGAISLLTALCGGGSND